MADYANIIGRPFVSDAITYQQTQTKRVTVRNDRAKWVGARIDRLRSLGVSIISILPAYRQAFVTIAPTYVSTRTDSPAIVQQAPVENQNVSSINVDEVITNLRGGKYFEAYLAQAQLAQDPARAADATRLTNAIRDTIAARATAEFNLPIDSTNEVVTAVLAFQTAAQKAGKLATTTITKSGDRCCSGRFIPAIC